MTALHTYSMPRPKTLPRPVDITVYADQVLQMYASGQSVTSIIKIVRSTLPTSQFLRREDVTSLLKERGVFRNQSATMKATHAARSILLTCDACNQPFTSSQSFTKYCKMCAPNHLAWSRLVNYGLSEQQFNALFLKQDRSCALCRTPFESLRKHKNKQTTIVIDHDHVSGRVRGLLCNLCNITLGHLERRGDVWLQTALTYVGKASI